MTVECDAVPSPASPTAIDNCDTDVEITYVETRIDGGLCPDGYSLQRVWTATDDCGNQDMQTQLISVEDQTAPILAGVPADVTVECDAIPSPASPTATDNCDTDVEITYVETRIDGGLCPDGYSLQRVWTATDNCGNQDMQTQLISVEDQTAPILAGVPADVTVECDAIPGPASPTATDNCDTDVELTFNELRIDGNCVDNYELHRSWTATDDCGNTSVQTQIINVQDTQEPVFSSTPADITVSCDNIPSADNITATDNCTADISVTFNETRIDGSCPDNYSLQRSWTAVDACGNQRTINQLVFVRDMDGPVISGIPANITVSCENIPDPVTPTLSDNCDQDVDISYVETRVNGSCPDAYRLERRWTATDNCGNQTESSRIIVVEDLIAPILAGVPTDISIECDGVPPVVNPTATDNCDADVDISFVESREDGNCPNQYTLTRTWTATDNCGNQDIQTQIIVVGDGQIPAITGVPADVTVSCDGVPAIANPSVSDNCDANIQLDFLETRTDGNCPDSYTLQRSWSATDACGNLIAETQTITVVDDEAPTLSEQPADITVACGQIPAAPGITAADNCDVDVDLLFDELQSNGSCPYNTAIIRSWTATDNCGNQAVHTQTITVEDTEAPSIAGVPADVTVNCNQVPNPAEPIPSDNCDPNPTLEFDEFRINEVCEDSYTLQRSWTATDACGNSTVLTQMIVISDDQAPVMAGVPADVTVSCESIPTAANVVAVDNCDTDIEIILDEQQVPGPCQDAYSMVRTWTATDNCGNQDIQTQTITVNDPTPPVLEAAPADLTVNLANGETVPPPATLQATDNCDADVGVAFNEDQSDNGCGYIITRTWTATDNCGNQATETQLINVTDDINAEIQSDNLQICKGESTLLTALPNDPGYTYSWISNGGSLDNPASQATNFTANANGTYTITVEINTPSGCQAIASTQVLVTGVTNASAFSNAPICEGETLTLLANGGTNYLWTGPAGFTSTLQNPVISNATAGHSGIYTVVVSDDNGCQSTLDVNVQVHADPVAVIDGDNQLCEGDDLQLTAYGGVSYQWTGPNGFTSTNASIFIPNVSSIHEGLYEVTVYAAANCQTGTAKDVFVRIFTAEANNNGPICEGSQLELYSSDGGVQYTWVGPNGFSSNQQNPVIPNADAAYSGTYTVIIDNGYCVDNATTDVQIAPGLPATANSNSPVCEGSDILLSATGGVNYSWAGPNGFASNDKNPVVSDALPVMSGTYYVTVSDASGCQGTASVDVLVGERVRVDYTPIHATCNELGGIVVGVAGGIQPYTFNWADLPGTNNVQDRTDLAPGLYYMTVTDAGGCTATLSGVVISDGCVDCEAYSGTLSAENAQTCLNDGSVTLAASPNGDMNVPQGFTFTFLLAEGGNHIIEQLSNNPVFTVNAIGSYTIHVLVYDSTTLDLSTINFGSTSIFDINSQLLQGGGTICGSLDLTGVTIEVLTVDVEVEEQTADNCNLGTGSATLAPQSHTYHWSDGGSGYSRNDLFAGTYTVTVIDPATACEVTIDITIDGDCLCIPPEVATVDISQSLCGLANGIAKVIVDGNPANYQYTWSANANNGVPNSIGNERSQLFSGIYTVTITFPLVPNCETIHTFTIGNIDGPELDSVVVTPATCEAPDGSVTLYPASYTYMWALDNFNGNYRDGLAADAYHILVINPIAPDCPNLVTVEVPDTNDLTATAQIITLPDCNTANGAVNINVLNGSGSYSFVWSDNPGINSASRTDLVAGDYSVTIKDNSVSACEFELTFVLDENTNGATINLQTPVMINCYAANNGQANYTVDYDAGFQQPATIGIEDTLGNPYNNGELIPGYYCLIVKDAVGCLGDKKCFDVIEPAPIDITTVLTDKDCSNGGSIQLTLTGGTPPYTYNWSDLPGSNDPADRTNLLADSYTVTVTDANDCFKVAHSLEINDNCNNNCGGPEITNIVVTEASCGQSNGSIAIETVEAASQLTFSWNPNISTGPTASNLTAGTYDVTISLLNDPTCFVTETIAVGVIDGPEVSAAFTSPATCDQADGTASLSPAGYDYQWSDSGQGANRTDLLAGTYYVSATDPATGCTDIVVVDIDQINPLQATATINQEPSCGQSNGSVTIGLTGGSGDYTFSWNAGETNNSLPSGSHSVTVVDNVNGCEATVDFVLTDNIPSAHITITDTIHISCAGAANGSVQFDINYDPGFTQPASIVILDANSNLLTNGSLPPGTHCLQVKDANDCLAGEQCFNITEPEELLITSQTIDMDCDSLGSINLTITGGVGNYTFDWADLPGSNDPEDRTDLAQGSYDVTVTDLNACTATAIGILINDTCQPCETPIISNTSIQDATCGNSNGEIVVELEQDIDNYTFNWSPAQPDTNYINELADGIYELTISLIGDPDCATTSSFTVNDINGPQANVASTTPAACTVANGSASLSPVGYDYLWSDGINSISRNDLAAGNYIVTVSDPATACTDTLEITIDMQTAPIATVTINSEPSCGQSNGSVTISVSNGSGDYGYSWGGGATRTDLASGSYEVTVTDNQSGCTTTVTFGLTDDVAGATVTVTPMVSTSCAGSNDGTASYTVNYDAGFQYPETIQVLDGGQNEHTDGSLAPGNYCIVVKDANGCVAGTGCFEVVEPAALQINVSLQAADCNSGGSIDLTISGGSGSYQYDWSDLSGSNDPEDRTDVSAGMYGVTVTDTNGCTATVDAIEVEDDCNVGGCQPPVVVSTNIQDASCGVASGSISIELQPDGRSYHYQWLPNVSTGNTATNLIAGTYNVTISVVGDASCQTVESLVVGNIDGPQATVDATSNASCNASDGSASLLPANYTYSWSDSGSGSSRNDLAAGSYTVTVLDPATGCTDILIVEIGQDNPLSATATINSEPSCGQSNGSVTISVSNGSGDYGYSWGGGATRTDLASGSYEVTVTDNQSGCTTTVTFGLTDDVAGATVTVTPMVSTSCAGSNDGTASYTVNYDAGFQYPETIQMLDGGQNEHTDGSLAPGNYCIVVKDANGCVAGTGCFEVVEPAGLTIQTSLSNVTCSEQGGIEVTMSGGQSPYSYDWSDLSGSNDPEDRSGLSAGVYELTVTDANGCTGVASQLIISDECNPCELPELQSVMSSDASCGQSNGRIELVMVGNSSNYLYSWSPDVSSTYVANNLTAGSYDVTITDPADASCFITESILINNIDGPQSSVSTVSAATCNLSDGSAQLEPSIYSYEWSDGQSGAERTDLSAQTYQVHVTDPATGCTNILEVTIPSENNLQATATINSEPSCGQSNGSVTISVSNGSGDYGYSWGGGATRTDLASGSYEVTVTDNQSGCTTTVTFGLTDDVAGATVTVTPMVSTSCAGSNDGTAAYTVNYDAGFQYPETIQVLDGGQNEHTDGSLAPGNYCIVVKDANGCVAGTGCFEVVEPAALQINVSLQAADCNSGGSIDLTISGGSGSYQYDWSDLSGSNDPEDRTDVSAGMYGVTVTDTNGCTATVDAIEVEDDCNVGGCQPPVVVSTNIQDASCGVVSGSISIELQPDGRSYHYQWLPNVSTGNTATNLIAGTYNVTISVVGDASCQTVESLVVGNIDGPQATVDATSNASCNASDGSASLLPANYTYSWSDSGSGSSRNDLAAGSYTVTVLDPATGCTDILIVEIGQDNPLSATATINSEPSCGQSNGSVTISVSNGSGDYGYSWGGGATRTDLASGSYEVTVTDNQSGCTTTVTFGLTDDVAGATVTVTPMVSTSCAGSNDGTASYTVNYDAGFQYPETIQMLDGGQNEHTDGSLAPGNYCIVVKDANGCVAGTGCFEVVEPAGLTIQTSLSNVTCSEQGGIEVTMSGGQSPYSYDWSDLSGSNDPEDRSGLSAGVYELTVTDANGCTGVASQLIISDECNPCELPELQSVMSSDASCGQSNGRIELVMVGNSSNYLYSWSPDVSSTYVANNLTAGSYDVTITDPADASCFITESILINNIDGPQSSVSTVSAATCNLSDGSAQLEPSIYSYEWSDGQSGAERTDLSAQTYQVHVTDPATGCTNILEVTIPSENNLQATATINSEPSCGQSNGSVTISVSNGSGDYWYSWGSASQTNLPAGNYEVRVMDVQSGCDTTLQFILTNDVPGATITITSVNHLNCYADTDGSITYDVQTEPGFAAPESIEILDANGNMFSNGNLPEGSYCAVVLDANGCIAGQNCFDIVAPDALHVNADIVNADCSNNGTISLQVNGGTPGYTYDWADLPGSNDPANRTDMPTGSYAVTITDTNGCSILLDNLMIEDDCPTCQQPVVTNAQLTQASCGQNNGAIELSLQQGVSNYMFSWLPNVSNSHQAVGLFAGTYEVTISQISNPGCFSTASYTIDNIDGLIATIDTIISANCAAADGIVRLSPATYNYSWPGGFTGAERTDLSAGEYQITVTDPATGCLSTLDVTVGQQSNLSATHTVNSQPNCGAADGSVSIQLSGGSSDYSYSWGAGETHTALAAGNYEVTVTDNQTACTLTISFILTDNVPGATITVLDTTDVSCQGAADGELVYTIDYDNGFAQPAVVEIIDQNSQTVAQNANLAAGSYCLNVTDANGCLAATACFDIEEPLPLTTNIAVVDKDCNEGGSISLQINGGTTAYTFDWADLPGSADPQNRTGLDAGFYSLTITDANGCQAILNDMAVQDLCTPCDGPDLTNVTVDDASCGNADGSIELVLNGDPASYSYQWSPNVSTTHQANNLSAGTYEVTISSLANPSCTLENTIVVENIDGPDAVITSQTPANCHAADGAASLSPATYTYQWSDGSTGATRSDLSVGTYQITVTDPATGCFNVMEIEIGEENNLNATATINQEPDCNASNGIVTIDVTGGSGNYTYSWGATHVQSGLAAGIYDISILDAISGCETNVVFALNNDVPQATIQIADIQQVSCFGASDGAVQYNISYPVGFAQPARVEIQKADGNLVDGDNLEAGSYCIVVFDANNCLAGQSCFDITEPDALDAMVNVTPANCINGGSIEVTISGGTMPYVYDWADLPGSNDTANRSDLPAGTYMLTLTDASGCSTILQNIIVADDCGSCTTPVITSFVSQAAQCGQSDGWIRIEMQGDEQSYSYNWSPAVSSSHEAFNLPAGTYSLTISEGACTIEQSFIINNVDGPAASLVSSSPANCGAADGAAQFSPSSYLYSWPDGATGSARADLTAGDYLITVTEQGTGCQNILELSIASASNLQTNTLINVQPDCNVANGTATIQVTGGSGNYTFSWGTNATQSGLSAGTYEVTVTDVQSACTAVAQFELTANVPAAQINITNVQHISCFGDMDGAVDYEVSLEPGFATPATEQIRDTADQIVMSGQLAAGEYCIYITDANGCLAGLSCFNLSEPEPLSAMVNVNAEDCTAGGSILLDVSGGTAPYNFDWADLPASSDPQDRTDLPAGLYQLLITDTNGCQFSLDSLRIENECTSCVEPEIMYFNTIDSRCGEANGLISIELLGDEADYQYSWSPNVSTTEMVSNLAAGTYFVTISDLSVPNCFITEQFIINNIDGPVAIIDSTEAANCMAADGAAYLSPANYMYQWSDGGTGSTRTDLLAGSHQITVTDTATACFSILEITIDQNNQLNAIANILTQPDCGVSNGSASIEVTGGSGSYTFNGDTSSTLNNLSAGNYTIAVVDLATSCETTIQFNLTEAVPQVSVVLDTIMPVSCIGDADGSVTYQLVPEPGFVAPANVLFLDMDGNAHQNGLLAAGEYCLVVEDANGCIAGQECFEIEAPEALAAAANIQSADCDSLGRILLSISGGNTGSMLFDWADLPGDNDPQNRVDLPAGVYEVLITDSNGCTALLDSILVGDDCEAITTIEIIADTIWVNTSDTLCFDLSELTTAPASITNFCDASSGEFVVFELSADSFCLIYTGLEVGQDSACIEICDSLGICDTTYVFVTVVDSTDFILPDAVDDIDSSILNQVTDIFVLLNDTLNGHLDTMYIVEKPTNGNVTIGSGGVITYIPDENYCNDYLSDYYTYAICNEHGCDTALVQVYVLCDELLIFTGVSPNDDGINDVFYIQGVDGFPENELIIFNRWGNEVYRKQGYLNDWSGTYKDKLLPDGTYFYIFKDGHGNTYSGYLQLHR